MVDIPTMKDADALRAAYKAVYGYDDLDLDYMEYRLLSNAHNEMFGDYVGNMCSTGSLEKLSAEIRACLENGIPYKRDIPADAII